MAYAKIIEERTKMYEGWIEELKAAEHHARMVEQVVEQFPAEHYHSSIYNDDLTVSFRFKSAKTLESVLSYLRGFGYRSVSGKDDPANKVRSFKIMKRGNTLNSDYQDPDILLKAYFLDDDATCKYVKVGTKTRAAVEAKEIDVFELQCDDPSDEILTPIADPVQV